MKPAGERGREPRQPGDGLENAFSQARDGLPGLERKGREAGARLHSWVSELGGFPDLW